MRRGSFPRRLFMILAVALLTLLAGGTWLYVSQEEELRQQAEADLQAIADLKVDQIVTWRAERIGDAAILTDSPFFIKGVLDWLANPRDTEQTELLVRLRSLQTHYFYYDVLLVNQTGQVQLSVRDQHDPLHPDSLQALADAFQSRQPVMTDLHVGPDDLPAHLDVVAPLFASGEANALPLAAVILRVDAAQFLYPLIQSWPVPNSSAETLLVRPDGDSVLFLNELRHQSGTALTLRIPLTQTDVPAVMAALGQQGVVRGLDYRGVDVFSVIEAIPDSPWFMIAKVDASEIFADWNFRALLILALVLGTAVVIAATSGIIWMREQKVYFQTLFGAEKAQQESERKYRLLFENMTVGFALHEMIFDESGCPIDYRFLEVNPAFEKLTGTTADQILGKTVREVMPGTEQYWIDTYGQVVQTEKPTTVREFAHLLGKYYDVWAFSTNPGQFGVVFTDITEHRRITQALQQSEERFRRAVDDAPFPILIHAEDGEVVTVNKVWAEITGYTHAEIPTVSAWTKRAYGEHRDLVEAEIDRLYALQERVSEGEYVITTRSGETRTWDFSSSPLGQLPDGRRLVLSMAMDVTERKQAAVALQESEERYRFLFENMQEGCQVISPEWRYLYLNDTAAMHGRQAKEDLQGQTMMACYPNIENTPLWTVLQECMNHRVSRQFENEFEYSDGSTAWFELRVQPVPEGIFILSLDISARKAAEAALRESEARYKSLFENTHAVMLLIDPATATIVDANPAACAYYGWSRAELGTMRIDQLNTSTPQEIAAAMQHAQHEEQPRPLAFQHRLADGTIRDVEIYSGPIEIQGQPLLFSIIHDVTDRKQIEVALQESEERLRLFIEHAPASLAMFNREMRYLSVSRRWLADYHLEDSDIIGQSHYAIFPEITERVKETHRRGLAGEVVKASEDAFVRANGTVQWVAWEMRPWYTAEGTIGGIVIFSEDITERKIAREEIQKLNAELEQRVLQRTAELEASNKELEAFSYSVSHDLRAPVRAMDGFSRILIEDFASELPPEAKRYLGLVRDNAQQMGSLIDHLLAFSRLGRKPLNKQEVNLTDLVRDVFNDLQAEQDGRDIDFTIEDLPPYQADPALLRQVFANLLGNALKFTRQRARAVIRVGFQTDEDGDPVYYVQDNGTGFDMQYADKLFGVFQRLHRAEDYEGSGVGLATVQRIIYRHGGRIWAEAEIDQGTTLYFTLGKGASDEH